MHSLLEFARQYVYCILEWHSPSDRFKATLPTSAKLEPSQSVFLSEPFYCKNPVVVYAPGEQASGNVAGKAVIICGPLPETLRPLKCMNSCVQFTCLSLLPSRSINLPLGVHICQVHCPNGRIQGCLERTRLIQFASLTNYFLLICGGFDIAHISVCMWSVVWRPPIGAVTRR